MTAVRTCSESMLLRILLTASCLSVLCSVSLATGTAPSGTTTAGHSEHTDCLTDMLRKSGVRPRWVTRYAALFRANGVSIPSLEGLSFVELLRLFYGPTFNMSHVDDVHRLHVCLSARSSRCSYDPFCRHGGRCVYSGESRSHVCECSDARHRGQRCQQRDDHGGGRQGNEAATTVGTEEAQSAPAAAATAVPLVNVTAEIVRTLRDTIAVTYTHWGKERCDSAANTTTVYSGYTAASRRTENDGGMGYMCLPDEPVMSHHDLGANVGIVSTVEIEDGSFAPQRSVANHDPACAVCMTRGRSSQIMIPATNRCPADWSLQYHGYLAGVSVLLQLVSELICIDAQPDVIDGSHADLQGPQIYPVKATCSKDLPCPPYQADKALLCVVCTR